MSEDDGFDWKDTLRALCWVIVLIFVLLSLVIPRFRP